MARLIQVPLEFEIPDSLTDAEAEALVDALRADVIERAVLRLWQEGEFSTREAAQTLQIGYEAFIKLLRQRGLPADNAPRNPAWVEEFDRELDSAAQP